MFPEMKITLKELCFEYTGIQMM